MRRSRFLLLGFVALVGCAPPVVGVRVDIDRILAHDPVAAPPVEKPLPKPPKPQPGQIFTMKGLPADFLSDPSRANSTDVEATIEKQQRAARRSLEARLRAVYHDQARQFQLNLEREISGSRPKMFEEVNVTICARFEKYADERAPLVTRLFDLVGFPDPNPTDLPPKAGTDPATQRKLTEASTIRKKLAAVEASYHKDKREILNHADDQLSTQEAAMFGRVRELVDRLERQAAKEAATQVPISAKDLGLQLTDSKPIVLAATKDHVVVIPPEAPIPPAPEVPSSGYPDGPRERRKRMERELRIWLGVGGYRLSPNGPDKTMEFESWRKKFRAGPSVN